MNTAGITLAVMAAVMQGQDINKRRFSVDDAELICRKLLRIGIEVPFEVVGCKSIFTYCLNKRNDLTADEVTFLSKGSEENIDFPKLKNLMKNKLEHIIVSALQLAWRHIDEVGIRQEVSWRKSYYKWSKKINGGSMGTQISQDTQTALYLYVNRLNLEVPFDCNDLKKNYHEEEDMIWCNQ